MVSRRQLFCAAAAAALMTGTAGRGAEQAPRDLAYGELQTPRRGVWAGEVFDLSLAWRVDWARFQNLDGSPLWDAAPIVAEPWQDPELSAPKDSSDGLATITFRTRALALQPGSVRLQGARQMMVVQTGLYKTDEYQRAVTGTMQARSLPAELQVRPLPEAPDGFLGAVGHFRLESSVEPSRVAVGQPVTWSLVFAGVGNWGGLAGFPVRRVSRAFDLAGAPKVSEAPGASLFERTAREVVTLVPRQAGRFVLGPVDTVVFDPSRGTYVRLVAPAVTVEARPVGSTTGNLAAGGDNAPQNVRIDTEETPNESLPRLMHGRSRAIPPLGLAEWSAALALPVFVVLGVWLMLAWQRARELDPERLARAAHARLRSTLKRLATASNPAMRKQLVRCWQKDAAFRCKLEHAAPIPASFANHDELQQLWADADRFLYSENGSLPDDWSARAARWREEQGAPPPFDVGTVFRPKNLFPVGCLVALLVACWTPISARAENGPIVVWNKAVEREPLDWRAHYNLAVSLAGEDRWGEAAAHAGVAWLQQPSPETREFWNRSAREGNYVAEAPFGIPLADDWRGRLYEVAPARVSQLVLVCCSLAAAGGAVLILFVGYGRAPRRLKPLGLTLFVGAGATAVGGGILLNMYQPLLAADAVLVSLETPLRALPVDTPAESEPESVQAGTLGRAGRSFLRWQSVQLADGRTGWVRQDLVVGIWRNVH